MATLRLVPKHWFSWSFTLEDAAGIPFGKVLLSCWRERGSVAVGEIEYRVRRDGFTGPFVVGREGTELARAVKTSLFRHEFTIRHEGRTYTLKRVSSWRREFGVWTDAGRVGTIAPESCFTRRAAVNLPDTMPVFLQAFCVWLTTLMWKRAADAATASS